MKLALQSTMVFFGTLLAAALVALGEPGNVMYVFLLLETDRALWWGHL